MVPSSPDNANRSLEFETAAAMGGSDRQHLIQPSDRTVGVDEVDVIPSTSAFLNRRRGDAATAVAPADPYVLVRQALRGRYVQFAVLTLLGAAIGAAAGWKLGKPLFRGEGLVRIAYTVPSIGPEPTDQSGPLAQYDSVMRSQQQVVTSGPIVQKAISDPAWVALGRGATRDQVDGFTREVSAQWLSGTQHLRVSFDDPDPAAAAAGANAVIRAYVDAYRAGDVRFDQQRTQAIDKHIKELEDQIAASETRIRSVAEEYGLADINVLVEMATSTAKLLEAKGLDLTVAMALASGEPAPTTLPGDARSAPAAPQTLESSQHDATSLTLEDIAAQSERMRGLLAEEAARKREFEDFTIGRGLKEKHPAVVNAKRMWDLASQRVQEFAEQYRQTSALLARYPETIRANPSAIAIRPRALVRQDAKLLASLQEKATRELAAVVAKRQEIEPLASELKELRLQVSKFKVWRDALQMASASAGRIDIVEQAEIPLKPYYDVRKKYAAAGAAGGWAVPAALVVLFGLRHRRYRYSDEAETDLTPSAPLLGILPALPHRLTDSEQAASASQCLHQIRARLQVGAGGTTSAERRRRVYLVTSGTPGEGKTSLAVSIGLSFAAAGTRTLVIDCDMVGQRVTRGFDLRGVPGLRDALAAGSVREYARQSVCGLWVVPVGTADVLDACAVSWGDMKRLLADARRYFDTIIIDSGPILGSVEATTIAPLCDGVIFTVSRGQQPALVEKALRHLDSIGAKLAGFVFNRAQARDFLRSAHASSLRSISADGIPTRSLIGDEATGRFGPLVQSVVVMLPAARVLAGLPSEAADVASKEEAAFAAQ